MIRVGRISYLNTEPFFRGWPQQPDTAPVAGPPRALALMALSGRVDCAPLPIVECWKLEPIFEPLGPWGIAVRKAAGSVLLFSKKKIAELDWDVIGVTDETSTSAVLLDLILRARYGIKAVLRRGFEPEDEARLLIGDSALAFRETGIEGFSFVYDLGREWVEWQNRPFVFAQWVVRRSLPKEAKDVLRQALTSSLAAGRKMIPQIAREKAPALGLRPGVVEEYLNGFSYEFGPAEKEAMDFFKGLTEGAPAR